MSMVSNCCGAPSEPDYGICARCKEHCVIFDDEVTFDDIMAFIATSPDAEIGSEMRLTAKEWPTTSPDRKVLIKDAFSPMIEHVTEQILNLREEEGAA